MNDPGLRDEPEDRLMMEGHGRKVNALDLRHKAEDRHVPYAGKNLASGRGDAKTRANMTAFLCFRGTEKGLQGC